MNWMIVAGLGVVGVSVRFGIDTWIARWAFSFPVGTLLINSIGCFIAGLIVNFGGQRDLSADPLRLGLIVGFCGGFTTFSGYGLQLVQLIESNRMLAALLYGAASPLLCLIATASGFMISRWLV
jgi:fluoride exporter